MCIMSELREEASFRGGAHSLYSFNVSTRKLGFGRPALPLGAFFVVFKAGGRQHGRKEGGAGRPADEQGAAGC